MPESRILVVEDETPIRRFLKIAVESAGFVFSEAERGRQGVEKAATEAPDLVVLDLGLPDMDGKQVIAAIREWSQVPILILSVRDAETEKIAALDAGADDYVTKPFATGELLARMRALLRSRKAPGSERSKVTVGELSIDLAAHVVRLGEVDVKLTRKEFDVLALLARHAGRLVTQKQLLVTVWGRRMRRRRNIFVLPSGTSATSSATMPAHPVSYLPNQVSVIACSRVDRSGGPWGLE